MRIDALLFDLDGTLIDSAPDLVGALNRLRHEHGLEPVPVEEYRRYVSRGAAGLLAAGMPPCTPRQFDAWKRRFLDDYARFSFVESRLYEGISELLDYLEAGNRPWGIVTNKIEFLTRKVIRSAGMESRAGAVVCGDTLTNSKPAPDPVLHACALLGCEPSRTLFVGDDVRDVLAGRAAGTRVAAVLYGYGSWEFDDAFLGSDLRVRHPSDIETHLEAGSLRA